MKPLSGWPANRLAHHLMQNPYTLNWHVMLRLPDGKLEDAGNGHNIATAYTKADAYVAEHHKGKTL